MSGGYYDQGYRQWLAAGNEPLDPLGWMRILSDEGYVILLKADGARTYEGALRWTCVCGDRARADAETPEAAVFGACMNAGIKSFLS